MAEVNTTPEQATAEPNAASDNSPAEPVTENQTASAPSTEKADENHSEKTDEPKAEPEKVQKSAEPEEKEAEKSSAEQTKTDENDSEKKIAILEGKVHALSVGVAADCIDDVLALAQAKVSDDVTLEQAIDNVIDKYPNFKGNKDKEIITTSVPTANDEQLAAEQEQAKKIMGIK